MAKHSMIKQMLVVLTLAFGVTVLSPAQTADAGVWDTITEVAGDIGDSISDFADKVVEKGKELADKAVEKVKEVAEKVKDFAVDVAKKILQWALDVGDPVGMAATTMEEFCDSYQKNIEDYSDQSNCMACKLFMLFFDAANETAGQVNSKIAPPMQKVLTTGSLIWLAISMLIFFSSIGDDPGIMGFLTKLGGMMIKVAFGYVMLSGGGTMAFNYFINPTLEAGALLSAQVMPGGDCGSFGGGGGSIKAPMSPGVRSAMDCMIKKIASGMAQSQAIAQGLRCGAFFWRGIEVVVLPKFYIPNPIMWAFGMILGCSFWFTACMFSMAMLDVIFRIGLLVGMIPLFVTAWVFPPTAQFAKSAWDFLINALMVFVIAGLTISILVTMVQSAWTAGGDLGEFIGMMQANEYVKAFDMIFDKGVFAGLGRMLIVITVAFWGVFIAPVADKFANEFMQTNMPKSVAIRAIGATASFIVDVIIFIITILTAGIGSVLYFLRVFKAVAASAKYVKKVKEMQDRMRKIRQKAEKIKRLAKQTQQRVHNVADKISSP